MTFRVGQKVVCVNADGWYRPHFSDLDTLVKGRVYTVAGLQDGRCDHPEIKLVELHPDKWMRRSRFRPVVKRKTDISVFTEILRTTKVPTAAERIGLAFMLDPRPAAELSPPGDKL